MIIGTPFLNAILKSFLLILLFILTSLKGKAQEDVNLQWIKSFGGQVHQIGHSTTLDSDGNIYTTGLFKGIVDFDPGTDTVNLTSIGFKDAFVLKLDSNGNYIWAVSIEGSVIENTLSVPSLPKDFAQMYSPLGSNFNINISRSPLLVRLAVSAPGSKSTVPSKYPVR